jgi:peroxiredoxin family protein
VTLFTTLAATRAFLAADQDGRPGWAAQPLSPELAAPGLADGAALDARNRDRGVAGFEELLQACVGLGVELIVCEMGLRAEGLSADRLRSDLPIQRAGLATLLARPGRIVVL